MKIFKKIKLKLIFKIIAILVIACIIFYLYAKTFIYRTSYLKYIEENCSGSGIDPYLVLSIIKVESGFNPKALSSKEAKGLMQIKDTTYSDVSDMISITTEINPYDPETNIKIGIAYFKKLVSKYNGNYYIALLAYNAGMGNVSSWISAGTIPSNLNTSIEPAVPFPETENYLKKVIATYNMYKFLYNL